MKNPQYKLIVPIRAHAIYQDSERTVVGPEMDFESLPYYDKELRQDINSDTPYLAESVISPPFGDANFILRSGVHINWDFPEFLKRTKFKANNPTELPAVPTRWLVSRYPNKLADGQPDQQWVVESDVIRVDESGAVYDLSQISIDVDIYSGERPFAYAGNSDTLVMWQKRKGCLGSGFVTWKTKHNNQPLTALGWGSPSFDIFYPNCRSVFGFYDSSGTRENRYKIIGWYNDIEDDYWLWYLKERLQDWQWKEIDELTHLDAAHRSQIKQDHIAKTLCDDLGIDLNIEQPLDSETFYLPETWERMVCCGEAEWLEDSLLKPSEVLYAVGNTPAEALSGLIAEKSDKQSDLERGKNEDRLAAVLMGDRLKSLKLDIGPKFREFRHADQFTASDGGVNWVIEKVDDNPKKQPPGEYKKDQQLSSPLPINILPLLDKLNEAQRLYDTVARELESQQFQLYNDWYRYMHASYPPPGETEEYLEVSDLLIAIERGSLNSVENLKNRLGKFDREQPNSTGCAARVAKAKSALLNQLEQINNDLKNDCNIVDSFHWELQSRAAPRFWQPAPPAVIVAFPRAKDEQIGDASLQEHLICHIFSTPLSFSGDSFNVDALLTSKDISWSLPKKMLSTDLSIFRGEWEAELFPVATEHSVTKSSGLYDQSFIETNYILGENEPDLDDKSDLMSPLALSKAGSVYTGSTYVNQNLDDHYRYLLQNYREIQESICKTLQSASNKTDSQNKLAQNKQESSDLAAILKCVENAERFLDEHNILVITLNGFNSALLQRHESIQLNPADPLGFGDYKAFAQKVAETLRGGFKGVSPDPHAMFMPIRSGGLRLMTLRLIDIFGQFIDLTPSELATALSMKMPGHNDWVRLPPRLMQPARWNFRFLQAESSDVPTESQSYSASSPVHGWVIPNLLDKSLDFFDPVGVRLGSVRTRDNYSDWDGGEFDSLPIRLRQIIEWLIAQDKKNSQESASQQNNTSQNDQTAGKINFLDEFINNIEEAIDNIHPDDREGQSAFSVIMGRPLAVVQLGIELEVKGKPAVNNSWSALISAVNAGQGSQPSTDGFDAVKFQYRMGDYRQRNDGLVGYWGIEQDNMLSSVFSVNDSITAQINVDKIITLQIAYTDRQSKNSGQAHSQWIDVKNEEWRFFDSQGQTLFEFLLNEENQTIKKQDIIEPFLREGSRVWDMLIELKCLKEEMTFESIGHYADEVDNLKISISDDMQQFIALIDPHGLVHLSSGIQPVKAIDLPDYFTKEALNNIEMSFLTGPLLTPENELHLTLPKEQMFNWNWSEKNRWTGNESSASLANADQKDGTQIDEQDIKSFHTISFFPKSVVLREGQMKLKQKTDQSGNEVQKDVTI